MATCESGAVETAAADTTARMAADRGDAKKQLWRRLPRRRLCRLRPRARGVGVLRAGTKCIKWVFPEN